MANVMDDDGLRALVMDAIPSAWAGLDHDTRDNVIDLLSTYDHVIALQQIAISDTTDPKLARLISDQLAALDAPPHRRIA